jgi:hemolysin activation/secretion protein
VGYGKSSLEEGLDFEVELRGAVLLGEAPRQGHYLIGGRGTVPGYAFRSQIGDRFWLFRAEVAKNVLFPWVRLRVVGAAGGTGFEGDPFPPPWPEAPSSRVLASAGGGVGLGWDVLRLDLARGLTGSGEWQIFLSVNPKYWPWL